MSGLYGIGDLEISSLQVGSSRVPKMPQKSPRALIAEPWIYLDRVQKQPAKPSVSKADFLAHVQEERLQSSGSSLRQEHLRVLAV